MARRDGMNRHRLRLLPFLARPAGLQRFASQREFAGQFQGKGAGHLDIPGHDAGGGRTVAGPARQPGSAVGSRRSGSAAGGRCRAGPGRGWVVAHRTAIAERETR
jgi:hypothetical protein